MEKFVRRRDNLDFDARFGRTPVVGQMVWAQNIFAGLKRTNKERTRKERRRERINGETAAQRGKLRLLREVQETPPIQDHEIPIDNVVSIKRVV